MALFEAHSSICLCPQATRVFDSRTLGFAQVKAAGLVQTFGLHRNNIYQPHLFTSELSLYLLTDTRTLIDFLKIKKVPIINDYQPTPPRRVL